MLLRLQSNQENTAEWTNTFNEDVIIPANSSVALMSLSCLPNNADSYVIGDDISKIGLKKGASGTVVFSSIPYKTYTKSELSLAIKTALTQIQSTFGVSCSFDVAFTGELLEISYTGADGSVAKYIVFESITMANTLGYPKRITDSETNVSSSFNATTAIQLEHVFTGNLIVECPSLGGQIQCYDSTTKSKHQVIASIPSLIQHNQTYVYQNNSPIYLELNNKYEINLRQITSRVLIWNNQPLPIQDNGCWITLSIK
jgi:hypothetical protein